MTLIELKNILDATGYPVAYSHFNSQPVTPYICYLSTNSSNFMADNKVYSKFNNVLIELYTDKKDLQAERKLEDTLDQHDIPYETSELFIDSEQLYQKLYEVNL
ncbi:hypothetical protein P9E76_15465 [Schinkia azotoformans]|uniref:Prophage pi2 protein 38 n=1 Tax=Schinkia azotoformans LMG 9581 TaxID=1131731 RepID=K6E4C4_SCHAZ|nr:hypothetical protein [Schinkia azotoformans]EKN68071.1 hypothetical protein BAZO_06124 [Schinkia azotoformans LMG 9581]MEC1638123.1 hypothetical protein [Schinkia azotoformans]MEC1946443.1 hypothetical protein [Schinkia azotoformans]